jgi:pimeloyl-ACP methyl ester carboxylesterase
VQENTNLKLRNAQRKGSRMGSLALLLLLLAVIVCNGLPYPRYHPKIMAKQGQTNFPAQWFTQTLDHFNALDSRTFKQRYYVNPTYWDKMSGIILLYINGEGPVFAPPMDANDEVVLLAQEHNAIIVTLEHRYYGLSVPFTDLSTDNLQYLSSKQALFDLAHFIVNFTSTLPPPPSDLKLSHRIITIGGSYSGALSAWFRLKYPQITCGSLSSSGVVNAILDFTAFDQQIATSVGPECANAMRMVTKEVETAILAGGATSAQMKASFGASTLVDDGDFFYFLADSMAEGVQYGYQAEECGMLLDAINNNQSVVSAYINYTTTVWGGVMGVPAEYATSWQQNITVDENKADRQWWFQTCSEFGYFQNAPAEGAIRSQFVNMTYHKTHCQNVFGIPLWPDTNATNEYYGGNDTVATNIFFANGSQDPWQWASVRSSLSQTEPALIITCENCGHCVDLRECPGPCTNQGEVDQARQVIAAYMGLFLECEPF